MDITTTPALRSSIYGRIGWLVFAMAAAFVLTGCFDSQSAIGAATPAVDPTPTVVPITPAPAAPAPIEPVPARNSITGPSIVSEDATDVEPTAPDASTIVRSVDSTDGSMFCDVAAEAVAWYEANQGPASADPVDVEHHFTTSADWLAQLDDFDDAANAAQIGQYRQAIDQLVADLAPGGWDLASIPADPSLRDLADAVESGIAAECSVVDPSSSHDEDCTDRYRAWIDGTEGSGTLMLDDPTWQAWILEISTAHGTGDLAAAADLSCALVAYLELTYGPVA